MKKLLMLAMVLGLMVSGCAYTRTGYWTKPDYAWEQYSKDRDECLTIAPYRYGFGLQILQVYGQPPPMGATHSRAFCYCMEMRGYEWIWNETKGLRGECREGTAIIQTTEGVWAVSYRCLPESTDPRK